LVEYGMMRASSALKAAARDLMSRGPGWRGRAREGVRHVAHYHPALASQLGEILKSQAPAGKPRNAR
jgi:hypothetical protein